MAHAAATAVKTLWAAPRTIQLEYINNIWWGLTYKEINYCCQN